MATITGTSGNDSILPSGVSAGVTGGLPSTAADTVFGGAGNDTMDGGTGSTNLLDYSSFSQQISITYTGYGSGNVVKGGGQTDVFSNFLRVYAGSGNDSLVGTAATGPSVQFMHGNAGNDQIDGLSSRSTAADYSNSPAAININLSTGVGLDGWGGTDTLLNVRRVHSSVFNDTLVGGAFGDSFQMTSSAGTKTIDGGGSSDRGNELRYSTSLPVVIDLGTTPAVGGGFQGTVTKNGGLMDSITRFTRAVGGAGADSILGTSGDDAIEGEAGNDVLYGRSGFDFVGYASTSFAFPTQGVVVNLATGTATDGWGNTDTLIEIEGAFGGGFADDLTGVNLGLANRSALTGLAGNDTLRGASMGFTAADYNADPAAVTVNLATGTANDGYGGTDTLININAARGSAFNDNLTGSANDDSIQGGTGNDTLTGGGGEDRLLGDDGNDSIDGGSEVDTITGSRGQDRLTGGTGGDRFNFTLNATPGDHSSRTTQDTIADFSTIEGDYIRLTSAGAAKADIIYAGLVTGTFADINTNIALPAFVQPAGIDALNAYLIRHTTTGGWVVVDENSNGTLEATEFAVRLAGGDMTQARVTGSSVVTASLVGDAADNAIYLSDTIAGGARGLDGNDTIYGGNLFDNMAGGLGNDHFVVKHRDTTLIEADFVIVGDIPIFGGEDTAWVTIDQFTNGANIEIVRMSGTAQRLQGSVTGEQIVANPGLASHLLGGGGDDVLWSTNLADTLDGGDGDDIIRGTGGADTMYGGLGNDQFVVFSPSAQVIEYLNGGYDVVYVSTASFTLGANIEEGRLSAPGAVTLIGSASNEALVANPGEASTLEGRGGHDTLYGSIQADTLRGGDGDDIIRGEGGADVMVGGLGNDQFVALSSFVTLVELTGEGFDILYFAGTGSLSFSAAIEQARLLGPATGLTYTGVALNKLLVGNNGGLASNINAGAGDDTVYGSTGNDILVGGAGNDTIYTLAGADLIQYGNTNFGFDQVADFSQAGGDKIQFLSGSGITSFAQVNLNAANGNTQVNTAAGNILVFGATLTSTDFIFG